jgi:hypothetical protein
VTSFAPRAGFAELGANLGTRPEWKPSGRTAMSWDDDYEGRFALWRAKFGEAMFLHNSPALWRAFCARLARYDEVTANLFDAFSLGKPLSEAQVQYMDRSLELFIAEMRRRDDVEDADG